MATKKLGITGQHGFIGRHLNNYLKFCTDDLVELIPFERDFFEDSDKINSFVKECDIIVHLAAMNRHEDLQVLYNTNVLLVQKLVEACEKTKTSPWIIMSSSSQESRDNPYGKSKRDGYKILADWADRNNAKSTALVIPNVFGPFGKPFYNSVFATFCHQVIKGETPSIIQDGNLKLIYVNELVEAIHEVIKNNNTGKIVIPHYHEMKVSELLEKLKQYYDAYIVNSTFPDLTNATDLAMFNSFRCYIPHDFYPQKFTVHSDHRGGFVEIVRANTSGQFSFSTTVPGITRGNHFHTRKAERFAVIKGKASIQVRKVDTDEIAEYIIDGSEPAFVDMPIWHTHNISNIGDEELITLFWINEPYNADDADTYFINV